jgi:hypothetical protein
LYICTPPYFIISCFGGVKYDYLSMIGNAATIRRIWGGQRGRRRRRKWHCRRRGSRRRRKRRRQRFVPSP